MFGTGFRCRRRYRGMGMGRRRERSTWNRFAAVLLVNVGRFRWRRVAETGGALALMRAGSVACYRVPGTLFLCGLLLLVHAFLCPCAVVACSCRCCCCWLSSSSFVIGGVNVMCAVVAVCCCGFLFSLVCTCLENFHSHTRHPPPSL